eukprot:14160636-Heterocapsa_arctica.AAC.1
MAQHLIIFRTLNHIDINLLDISLSSGACSSALTMRDHHGSSIVLEWSTMWSCTKLHSAPQGHSPLAFLLHCVAGSLSSGT